MAISVVRTIAMRTPPVMGRGTKVALIVVMLAAALSVRTGAQPSIPNAAPFSFTNLAMRASGSICASSSGRWSPGSS